MGGRRALRGRGHSRRVNRQGVLLLAVLFMFFIALLQVLEEGAGPLAVPPPASVSGSTSASSLAKGLLDGARARMWTRPEKAFVDRANEARNVSEFARVVARGEGTLVLTYVSNEYRATLLNWLLALERVGARGVGIVCLDRALRTYLYVRGIPCFLAVTSDSEGASASEISSGSGSGSGSGSVGAKRASKQARGGRRQGGGKGAPAEVAALWVLRMRHLLELLRSGTSVVLSDADAVWVENSVASGLLGERTGDVVLSRGKFPQDVLDAWGATACMGVAYFRAATSVAELVERALEIAERERDDQVGLNRALLAQYGADPFKVFGNRLDVLSSTHDVAPAVGRLPRLVLLSHNAVPRFCNELTPRAWATDVAIAHCHATDGERQKTFKLWGDSKSRTAAMEKYGLFCAAADRPGQEPDRPDTFFKWVRETALTCDFISFRSSTPSLR